MFLTHLMFIIFMCGFYVCMYDIRHKHISVLILASKCTSSHDFVVICKMLLVQSGLWFWIRQVVLQGVMAQNSGLRFQAYLSILYTLLRTSGGGLRFWFFRLNHINKHECCTQIKIWTINYSRNTIHKSRFGTDSKTKTLCTNTNLE